MDNKCSKYEGLFVFSSKDDLEKHIEQCEDCKSEQKKMDKVSSLIDEVKFYYHSKRRKQTARLRAACAVMFLVFSAFSLGLAVNDDDLMDTLKYGDTLSAEDLGFPVDSDGLLMVDE